MITRLRTKVIRSVTRPAHTISYTNTFCSDGHTEFGSVAGNVLTNKVSAAVEERITDALGRGSSHPVIHRKWSYDVNDSLSQTMYASTSGGNNIVQSYSQANSWFDNSNLLVLPSWNVSSNAGELPPDWTMSLSVNESVMKNDVYEQAKQLKADHLLNLIEAGQTADLWPQLKNLVLTMQPMAANWRNIRKVVKTASGSFLAWKFGVSPILSDIMATQRAMPKIIQTLKRHKESEKHRYSKIAVPVLSYPAGTYFSASQNGYTVSKFTRQGRLLGSPELRYVLVVKPTYTFHTDFFRAADVFMSRFATSPASLAWEKVPFSFVVDWFVDLRGALKKLDDVLGFAPFEIVSFTRSFRYSLGIDKFLDLYSPCNGSQLDGFKQCSAEYTHYERIPVSIDSSINWKPHFGKSQAGITAALIGQQLSKLH